MNSTEIRERLAAPFGADEVKYKPGVVSGQRALALAYVDARAVMDRLDAVLGMDGWRDSYQFLADGVVLCRLSIRVGEEWITREDVGSPSEQPDDGDRVKAAVSDALKRAAVKFGVGRHLYRLPSQWVDYDPQRKRFTGQPVTPRLAPAPAPVIASPETKPLADRLRDYDRRLVHEGRAEQGQFLHQVREAWLAAGLPASARDMPAELAERAEGIAREVALGYKELANCG